MQLIPVTTKMRSANNMNINILGAVFLHISGLDSEGNTRSTHQMTYITDCSSNFYLSRAACEDLGIISYEFPTVGEAPYPDTIQVVSTETQSGIQPSPKLADCGCPERTVPPPVPSLPFPATESNLQQLEDFILDYFKSSTFNICPHQPLPFMSGPPMGQISFSNTV